MALPITGLPNFPTKNQIPDHSIMDINGKQAYLGCQFVANTGNLTISTTSEVNVFSIANPTTNSKSLFIFSRAFIAEDNSDTLVFNVYANPTVLGGGSTITPINCRLASSTTSNASVLLSPTATTRGTLMSSYPTGFGYYPVVVTPMIILDPGKQMLVTVIASGGTSVSVEFFWNEM